jgi:hypothetical protein
MESFAFTAVAVDDQPSIRQDAVNIQDQHLDIRQARHRNIKNQELNIKNTSRRSERHARKPEQGRQRLHICISHCAS